MKTLEFKSEAKIFSYDELSDLQRQVAEAAQKATSTSYSPYSRYAVGAAVLLDNGEILTGSNQENVAYPQGLCAERTVLFYAGAHYPESGVRMLAIAARRPDGLTPEICSPCGGCRQVIAESEDRAGAPIQILLCSATEVWVFEGIESLMPLAVRAGSLEKNF